MGRSSELASAWLAARNHNALPTKLDVKNPMIAHYASEHTAPAGVAPGTGKDEGMFGGYHDPNFEGPLKPYKAKGPPKSMRSGAFPEPGMNSDKKPCKSFTPAISIGHEHACGNCGWNHS